MAKWLSYYEGWRRGWLSRRLLWVILVFTWPCLGFAVSFTATLDRTNVTVGESVTLSFNFDAQPDSIPAPPSIPNLQIENQGISRSVSIANGQVSSTIAQTFVVTPLQPGEYEIPALQATVGGQTLTSEPLKLVAAQGEQLAFFKLALP